MRGFDFTFHFTNEKRTPILKSVFSIFHAFQWHKDSFANHDAPGSHTQPVIELPHAAVAG